MKIYIDCLPCILRQVLEASRMASADVGLREEIMSQAVGLLAEYKQYSSSPEICRDMHAMVKSFSGVADPYSDIKQRDLDAALRLYPHLSQYATMGEGIGLALKVSATGNVLDSAINPGLCIEECIDHELGKPFGINDEEKFKQQLDGAKSVLVIGDNAGETVFDRVLLENLRNIDITYAVRSAPVINDATIREAQIAGVDKVARIVSTGCDAPGTILSECSDEFLKEFYSADIVISKGQGNYETLSDCTRSIYFLLKAKCPVISGLLDVNLNDYVFMHNGK